MMRRTLVTLAFLGLVLAGLTWILFATHEEPPVDPAWAVEGDRDVPPGAVTVRWTGTSTLVVSDGVTTLLIDGWFTRIDPLTLYFGSIEPDVAAIEAGLERNEVTRAAMVLPVHSHFDHAMDAPEVARRTGALLVGSESTANIGRGWGLPESRIKVVGDGDRLRFGDFEIVVHESRHFEFPDPEIRQRALGDPEIVEPLVPPVETFAYKVGVPLAVEIAHPRGTLLVQGSAGYVPGALSDVDVDVVLLGVGGLGSQTPEYREAYWRETVETTSPTRVIPIHWDDLTAPIDGPFRGSVRIASMLGGGDGETLSFLKEKERSSPDIQFLTLPRYDPVILY